MQINQIGNVSFTGLAHIIGSEEDAVAIAKKTNATCEGFGEVPTKKVPIGEAPMRNWLLSTGDDKKQVIELRQVISNYCRKIYASAALHMEVRKDILKEFTDPLPKLDAKEVLKGIQNRTFDLAELTFKKPNIKEFLKNTKKILIR